MNILSISEALLGAIIVALIISDAFQTVIMPRAVGLRWRLTAVASRISWRCWKNLSWRIRDQEKREEFLALFAPLLLVGFLLMWALALTIGYGFIFHAFAHDIRPIPSLSEAFYFSGSSFLTLGFGDFVGMHGAVRALSLLTAGTGVATVAVVTAFLFSIFGAFQRRETFIVTVGHAAGAPPSGIHVLSTYAKLDMRADLGPLFRDAQTWAAEVMESHLAYPILMFFRSSHDDESWVASLGALLDAATLATTTIAEPGLGQARLFIELGTHVTRDFTSHFGISDTQYVGVEREEFLAARNQLVEVGFTLHDEEISWKAFREQRLRYAANLNALARFFHIPPAQWIGDRSYLTVVEGLTDLRHR